MKFTLMAQAGEIQVYPVSA